jgi:epoxyqueuosine reductase
MNQAIRQRARDLGFDDCRITTADPPLSAPQFQNWLELGRQGEMAYLARNAARRLDPQQVLPTAKSIVALAISYARARDLASSAHPGEASSPASFGSVSPPHAGTAAPLPPAPRPSRTGLVARYARSQDYHHVVGERLKLLAEFINQLGGPAARSMWYVDTGPLLERDLAQRAGLGFIGKHTNLISRQLGNWFFLAEILTTLALDKDDPERNRCGSCTRCLTACPTGAITAPFELDARRCISYLTIELKGPIPLEWRPAIGNRIFGCDDCLEVCPWNRFAREGRLLQAHARPDLATPDLLELLALDEAGFKRRFAGTPLDRAKRRGLLRNVAVALGNTADETPLPALQHAAADPEPLIAEHARWAIDQIQGRRQA